MTQPIKVLRVIARLNVGGPALHVAYLAAGLQDRGYETTLVAGTLAYGEESMAAAAEARGVKIVPLADLHRDISPLDDLRAVIKLARLIRRERPQILHTHTAKAGTVGRIAALLAGDARPPIVVHTFHGHVLRGYFTRPKTLFFRVLEQLLARVSTALIAVSPEVRDDLVRLGVAPQEKFAVVRLGIELDERVTSPAKSRAETRRSLGVPDDAFLIGWVGRMTAVKRVDELITAFAQLRDRGADAYLVLVGDGPDRDALERRAHDRGVVRRCMFVGYQQDVASFYDAIDALVLPSANEGTPVSVIEALAAGRPAVATEVGGVGDIIRSGVDGILVAPGDTDALSDALMKLVTDPEMRERMGSAGSERVRRRYAVARLIDDVDRLYRVLLAGASPPRSP